MEGLDFHAMTADMAARMSEFYQDPNPWEPPSSVLVTEHSVPGPHGPIPYRRYDQGPDSDRALVWVHGGGFATGDLDGLEAHMVSSELARRSGATIFSIDYRLARNGVQYPVPLDDVDSVLHEALTNESFTTQFRHVAVGGASAGAALAVAAALRCIGQTQQLPSAVLLAYPFTHFPNPAASPALSAELACLPAALRTVPESVAWMVHNYVGRLTDLPEDALPDAADLPGLPPTFIVLAEYDDLRTSAELLQKQLEQVGVPVSSYLAEGMTHGHLNRGTSLAHVSESLDFFADALRG